MEPGANRNESDKRDEPAPEPAAAAPAPEVAAAPEPAPVAPAQAALLPPRLLPDDPPDTPAPPPGRAPRGDSRSFRRTADGSDEFCLIYRYDTQLIVRRGVVGKLGTFTVTQYPNHGSAAHAYAQECSTLGQLGFRDFRG